MNNYYQQAGQAVLFYLLIIILFRVSGKRLAGQTTTFDLVILISLSVATQRATLLEGTANTVVFMAIVLFLHHLQTRLCMKYEFMRTLIRGKSAQLIEDGIIDKKTLKDEGLTMDELNAGLRKAGIESPEEVKAAHLEETGHITVIKPP